MGGRTCRDCATRPQRGFSSGPLRCSASSIPMKECTKLIVREARAWKRVSQLRQCACIGMGRSLGVIRNILLRRSDSHFTCEAVGDEVSLKGATVKV